MNRKSTLTSILITASAFLFFMVIAGLGSLAAAGKSPAGLTDNQFTSTAAWVPSTTLQLAKGPVGTNKGRVTNAEPVGRVGGTNVEPVNTIKDRVGGTNLDPVNGLR
jgi:hypothetical protein